MDDETNLEKLPKLGANAETAWKGFLKFDQAALADSAIPKKHNELMAVAVALATQCPYCLEVYSDAARQASATEAELAEAAFVSAAIMAGGALTHPTQFLRF